MNKQQDIDYLNRCYGLNCVIADYLKRKTPETNVINNLTGWNPDFENPTS